MEKIITDLWNDVWPIYLQITVLQAALSSNFQVDDTNPSKGVEGHGSPENFEI